MEAGKNKKHKRIIYEKYRLILGAPELTETQIETMRSNVILLAQTICEHIWGKTFY